MTWCHVRRKFDEAIKGQKKNSKTGKAHHIGLSYIQKLYRVERTLKEKTAAEKKSICFPGMFRA